MARETIDHKIFERILKKNKENLKEQAIRDGVSRVHKKYRGITLNAAAHLFAEKHKVAIWRYLKDKDIESLKHVPQSVQAIQGSKKFPKQPTKPKYLPESKFSNEAFRNEKVYPYVYILENSLRNLILEKFEKEGNWWNNKAFVSNDIQEYAEKVKKAESKYSWMPKRAKHPIYYVGLEQLFKIITKNWQKYFKDVFTDFGDLRTWGRETVPIRHLIAHNIPTRKIDEENIRIKTDYILNCIKNSKKG